MLNRWTELNKIVKEGEEELYELNKQILKPFWEQVTVTWKKKFSVEDFTLRYDRKKNQYSIEAELSWCGCCSGDWEYWYVSKESLESGIFTEEELKSEETKRREKKEIEDKEKAAIDEKKQYEKLKVKYEGS